MTNRKEPPQQHAYVLRFWETRSQPPDPPSKWRFSLEDLKTDEEHKFSDLSALTAFLQAHVSEEGAGIAERGRSIRQDDGESAPSTQAGAELEASVLLVEGDAETRSTLQTRLRNVLPGCAIDVVGSSVAASAIARAEAPQVILVGAAPDDPEAIQAVQALRASAPGAVIVALTLGEEETYRKSLLAAGASACMAAWRINEELADTLQPLMTVARDRVEGKTVVCIEDEPDMLQLIQFALARYGINLVGVLGGREGLDAIRRVQPDLVLLDLMMPDIDGWQVVERVRSDETMRDIPVIVISALEPYWGARQGLDLSGVDGYVTKPFMPQELAERISAALQLVA
ncbi:MAG: response regulator [Anaerolineae bacterium]|jgi:DNA-binding response OmpR family regulator